VSVRRRGPLPGWKPSTPRQKAILADAVDRYRQHDREGTLPRGGRGIFYDLRPSGYGRGVTYRKPDSAHPISGYGPMEAHPALVQEVILLARRAGIIPESWVADQRAPLPAGRTLWDESAEDKVDSIARYVADFMDDPQLDLDPQRFQPVYVEVWCEAADLSPRLARVAEPYGVAVYSGGGYDGLKGKRQVAERATARDVPTVILHVGDYDPHGNRIFTAVSEDAVAWADSDGHPDGWLEFRRLALTREQAEQHGLLDADGKAEADALPVPVLDAILIGALNELLLPAGREQAEADETEQRKRLSEAIREALRDVLGE
jgi:hypothetical protein